MKKTLSILFLAGVALASCKKDYTCECTTTTHTPAFVFGGTTFQEESSSSTTSSTTIKDKKDDAKSSCESKNGTSSVPSPYAQAGADPTTTTVSCAIK